MLARTLTVAFLMLLGVVTTGCEQLGLVENNRTRIRGDWRRVERSFPSGSLYAFEGGVIAVDDIEVGSYRFEGYDRIEVTFDRGPAMYEIEFPDDNTMLWHRRTTSGRVKAFEWRRAER